MGSNLQTIFTRIKGDYKTKGLKRNNKLNFPLSVCPPPLSGKKMKKTKNDLIAMKQILYDIGPLTLGRWPLKRALKV